MQRFFNRKNTVIFTVLLILCFVAATSLLIARSSYEAKAEAIEAEQSGDGEDSALTDRIVGYLGDLLAQATEGEGGETAQTEPEYTPAQLKYMSSANMCLGFSIALYVLTVVFMGLDIACAAYDAYLDSDKYRAKQRQQRLAEKRRATTSK